jgi:hypothetical protein
MSQIYSLDARFPRGGERYSTAYSGLHFSPSTGRSRPDTYDSRATTPTKVPSVKQLPPTARSAARPRSHSRRAPNSVHSTKVSNIPQQSKPSTPQSDLVPVPQERNDAESMRSGFSGHSAEPAYGARLGALSKPNVRDLGGSTGGGRRLLDSWVRDSLKSADSKGYFEVVEYRAGLGPKRA